MRTMAPLTLAIPQIHERNRDVVDDARPKPRAPIDAASCIECSSASSKTGTAIPRTPAKPFVGRPRSFRAERTRDTAAMISGVKHMPTVTATAISLKIPGRARRTSLGLATALATPNASNTSASFNPSVAATMRLSAVTGPPRLTPCAQDGRPSVGRVNNTCPGSRCPRTI